ncbi:MAG: 30S ribosomal protein S13 [Candidatus Micrarchaeota archaeon]
MVKKQDRPDKQEKPEKTERQEKKAPAPARKQQPQRVEKESFRGIVRIAGKDVKGEVRLKRALTRVRGIGQTMAVASAAVIKKELSIDPEGRVGDLTEQDIERIDKVLGSLQEYGIPKFLMNRRNDFAGGSDRHVIMNDLIFEVTQDVEREKKMNSWIGYRHAYGQKVRGQRTRNTGRTGMAVGVLRKAIIAAQGGAPAGAKAATGAAAAPAAGAKAPAPAAAAKTAAPAAKPAEKK